MTGGDVVAIRGGAAVTRLELVVSAIRDADRCERFCPEEGEPCDGWHCERCLLLAAQSVLEALE